VVREPSRTVDGDRHGTTEAWARTQFARMRKGAEDLLVCIEQRLVVRWLAEEGMS
jgi:hypothetical protein